MSRLDVRWGLTVAGIAGLALTTALAPAHAAQTQATPVPVDCGSPVMSWGGGIADDVVGESAIASGPTQREGCGRVR